MIRGDVQRCLIVAPGSLVTQWEDELVDKFGLRFDVVNRDLLDSTGQLSTCPTRSIRPPQWRPRAPRSGGQ